MKKIEKMIHQIIRFRGKIEAFLVSIEEFSSPIWNIRLANLSIRYYFFTSDEENEGGVTEAAAQPT